MSLCRNSCAVGCVVAVGISVDVVVCLQGRSTVQVPLTMRVVQTGICRSFHGSSCSYSCSGRCSPMMSAISMSAVVGLDGDRRHDCIHTKDVVTAMKNLNSIVVWSFPMMNLVYSSMRYRSVVYCAVVPFVQVLRLGMCDTNVVVVLRDRLL